MLLDVLNDLFLYILSLSWETERRVTLGDFALKIAKNEGKSVFNLKIDLVETKL